MSRAGRARPVHIRALLIVIAGLGVALGLVRGFFGLDRWSRIMVVLAGGAAVASVLFVSGIPALARLVAGRLDPGSGDDPADGAYRPGPLRKAGRDDPPSGG